MSAQWETWETNTEIGPRLLDAWDGGGSVFIVTRSFEVYQELARLNSPSLCRWLSASPPSKDDDDVESIATVQTDDHALPDIGVIGLGAPRLSYEKSKAGLPVCFLFGRRSANPKVDVYLGRSTKSGMSRVHFALGLVNGNWAVRNLCRYETLVNGDTPLTRTTPSLALQPGRRNIIRVADLELELYCRDINVAASRLTDSASLPFLEHREGTDPSSSSLTTTPDAGPTYIPPQLADRLYILKEQALPSRTQVKKFLALDAWTYARYVVKGFSSSTSHLDALNKRLALLRSLPLDGPFIRDESIRSFEGALYLLTRFREDVFPLQEACDLATLQSARKLLRVLLKIVAQLHRSHIVHNDICLSTVYIAGFFDPESPLDNVLLTGFSEATGDMTRARSDCFQVFRTVQEFLGRRVSLPRCWTGDEHLDNLWHHLCTSDRESWPCTVQEVCSLSDIGLSPNLEEPKTITVSKGFTFKHTSQQDVSYLSAEDVKEYLSKDAVRCAGKAPSTLQVQSLIQKAFSALEPCIHDGQITVQDYCYFREHMKERHSNSMLGLRLFMSLPNRYYIRKPIQFNLSFPVPYFSRHGLVNLEYLRNLASTGFNPDILKPLLPLCHEVRGFPEARGVYISVEHLDIIAERLGLRIENEYDVEAADKSLDEYTYQDWYLLAPNPMSKLFPVNRGTNQVLTSLSPPTYTSLRIFLEDHFETKTYLDSQVVHDPEKLLVADPTEPLPHSCGGSVEASSNDVGFRFSHLPKPSLLLETKEKRRAETSAWVEEQEEERWNRRRAALSSRADITPTRFCARKAKA